MSPVLDPNPQNGQKKLLLVLGAMLLVTVIIAVIASVASPEPRGPDGRWWGWHHLPLGGQGQGQVGGSPDGTGTPASVGSGYQNR